MYKTVIEKICPKAVITVDRFHVTKILHQELNQEGWVCFVMGDKPRCGSNGTERRLVF